MTPKISSPIASDAARYALDYPPPGGSSDSPFLSISALKNCDLLPPPRFAGPEAHGATPSATLPNLSSVSISSGENFDLLPPPNFVEPKDTGATPSETLSDSRRPSSSNVESDKLLTDPKSAEPETAQASAGTESQGVDHGQVLEKAVRTLVTTLKEEIDRYLAAHATRATHSEVKECFAILVTRKLRLWDNYSDKWSKKFDSSLIASTRANLQKQYDACVAAGMASWANTMPEDGAAKPAKTAVGKKAEAVTFKLPAPGVGPANRRPENKGTVITLGKRIGETSTDELPKSFVGAVSGDRPDASSRPRKVETGAKKGQFEDAMRKAKEKFDPRALVPPTSVAPRTDPSPVPNGPISEKVAGRPFSLESKDQAYPAVPAALVEERQRPSLDAGGNAELANGPHDTTGAHQEDKWKFHDGGSAPMKWDGSRSEKKPKTIWKRMGSMMRKIYASAGAHSIHKH